MRTQYNGERAESKAWFDKKIELQRERVRRFDFPTCLPEDEWNDFVDDMSHRELIEVAQMNDDELFEYIHYAQWCQIGDSCPKGKLCPLHGDEEPPDLHCTPPKPVDNSVHLTPPKNLHCTEWTTEGLQNDYRGTSEGTTERTSEGRIRQCAIYSTDRRSRRFFLMQQQADEIQRLLGVEPPQDLVAALYWLRWSYQAERGPDAFLFAWMALERLVGEEDRKPKCSQCGKLVACPEHGSHSYRSVSPSKTKKMLVHYKVGNPPALIKLRHSLVHGGLKFSFEKRVMMQHAVPLLWGAVEAELEQRLGRKTVVHNPGSGRVLTRVEHVHCQYQTSHPTEAFPPDCPNYDDVKEFKEAIRSGFTHSKIVNLLPWPPSW